MRFFSSKKIFFATKAAHAADILFGGEHLIPMSNSHTPHRAEKFYE
ncbi:MAG TPA: hypothetical protein VJ715_15415 [Pyrinomonadaceae bacterium]|nr:hypothetical protein [Pyrinomonadaceae bacterium]